MKTILSFILLFGSMICHAQTDKNVSITIKKASDPNTDSISFVRSEKYFSTYSKTFLYPVEKDSNGNFSFKVPKKEKFSLVTFNQPFNATQRLWGMSNQIVEPGDSVVIDMRGKDCIFSGRGHEKYEVSYKIFSGEREWYTLYIDSVLKAGGSIGPHSLVKDTTNYMGLVKYFDDQSVPMYSKINFQQKILKEYKGKIDPNTYEIIKTNIVFANVASILVMYRNSLIVNKSEKISEEFISRVNKLLKPTLYTFLSKMTSPVPQEQRLLSCEFSNLIVNASQLIKYFGEDPVSWIEENFQGELRDRLLLQYFITIAKKPGSQHIVPEISRIVKTDYCKDALASFASAVKPGSEAFNFSLTDITGKKVTLSQFKGKTVVMDFWFTGCTGCLNLAPHMKMVYDAVKDNPNIVFLSINVDKSSERWKESALTHAYSPKGAVELYTDGLGNAHPLIQHYKIQSYPTLILIDRNGKLISANPEKPTDNLKKEKFIALISN